MGHSTHIYGFIEFKEKHTESILEVFSAFEFDEKYPFRNCFSEPRQSYSCQTIAYADCHKMANSDEWQEWTNRFEQLLDKLEFFSAVTHYVPAESSEFKIIHYFKLEGKIEKLSNSFTNPAV